MNAIHLLAEVTAAHPELAALPWRIDGNFAMANLEHLAEERTVPDPDHPGRQILKIKPAPKVVPIINRLHAAGWKRGDIPQGCGFWVVYADLKKDGAHIRVAGMAHQDDREVGHDNTAVPFFAPEPPPLGRGKKFLAAYHEWERKCHEDEW